MTEERYTRRAECLDTAKEYVTRDRNATYGEPDQDFQRIARILSAMGFTREGEEISSADVAQMMIALKLSRLHWNPTHKDSWVDIAGYAACGMETALLRDESSKKDSKVLERATEGPTVEQTVRAVSADDTHKRCYSPNRHEPHTWPQRSLKIEGMGPGRVREHSLWCDGEKIATYDSTPRIINDNGARDLDTIKAVADRFVVKPRPIRDNPQA